MQKIGVFDSGRGGRLVAERLQHLLPHYEYVVADDTAHVPYGTRKQDEIIVLTERAIQPLLVQCRIVVIACNTVTTAAIRVLRDTYPETKFVGLEPMIKPASTLSHNNHITMLATPYTLSSARYQDLKKLYAPQLIIDEPITGDWPLLIESGKADEINLDAVRASCENGSDVVVLGCTHYLALINHLRATLPDGVMILEPSEAIARQVRRLLQ